MRETWLVAISPKAPSVEARGLPAVTYATLFFFSGFPALIYQIVWQRALFTVYGVNTESVTVIVTGFMLGLGLGSFAGGWLSKRLTAPLLAAFGAIEIGIAVFGLFSLQIFHRAASLTAGGSTFATGLVTFALMLVPTLLMGSTLPLLVEYLVRRNRNVGESVGILYAVNTFGSGLSCFLAAAVLMRTLGESGSVRVAALVNTCVGIAAWLIQVFRPQVNGTAEREEPPPYAAVSRQTIVPLGAALILSAGVGLIALSYEIVWYRLFAIASARSAGAFAQMLGWYLLGVAYGSLKARDTCHGKSGVDLRGLLQGLGGLVIIGSVAAFLVGPALGVMISRGLSIGTTFPLAFVGAAVLGAVFPLLSHVAIDPAARGSGARLSYLYLANILGCASGSFVVGFGVMQVLSLQATSVLLLALGMALSIGVLLSGNVRRPGPVHAVGLALAVIVLAASGPLYSGMYERLVFKERYVRGQRFDAVAESRTGTVMITPDLTVYGSGIYDGHINVDLVHDVNGIFRAFAVDALHPSPKRVLLIGLSMGAWAQVIAANPRVESLTAVEIDTNYLTLIPRYDAVAGVLHNPKVEIVIDDGRRWLVRNRDRRFDVVVMNTPQHWMAHASSLLSVEFLRLVRSHLNPGGIHYYNATFSTDALLTGVSIFPYALRVGNFIAVSDSPIHFDKERWRASLTTYRLRGSPVFDMTNVEHKAAFTRLLSFADTLHDPNVTDGMRLEDAESMRRRFRNSRLVTDDNMLGEWSPPAVYASQ